MKTSKVISVSIVGDRTSRSYSGQFTTKTVMTMKDEFQADLRRRQVIGPSPDGTPPAANLQWRAFMLGQIAVKVLDAPKWWLESNDGLELEDGNVITELYEAILAAEEEVAEDIKKESEEAMDKLKKKKKITESQDD
jgi:hypothetical protein